MMPPAGVDLTVVILTYNEAHHIERAIESVRGLARAVLVVDSYSDDATVALAQAAGATVLQHRFTSHAAQLQWALDHAGIATGWTMRLDADELIEADLAAAIVTTLPTLPPEVSGIELDRKHVFMGRWIRHGGRYPLRLLRLWRTGHARVEQRWMDEHILLERGASIVLAGGFVDENLGDLTFFTAKHNGYATREAVEVIAGRHALFGTRETLSRGGGPKQARGKRRIKALVYDRLPLWAAPLGYFLYRFIVQRGFLDGRAGLIYHVLQGFWYRFLVAAKVVEFERALAGCTTREARIAKLCALTGLPIGEAG
ncbi:glycosyltransferase family 2 protein [Sphingomonas sp. NBWT7]|uniref:glycosyltransferase family 2 protein n=1 Tax=Sphingomonas sp. NBWT7 TaxID=2596913 RepID=UPI0021563C1B|nr:glycosyltransferase family 2 protein [Sphingomonas sp. NBWT7]